MATTASGDVKIYQPQMQGAFVETIQQHVPQFNQGTGGAIMYSTGREKGQYDYEAFFDEVSSINRRDPSAESSSTVTPTKLTQDDFVGVKLHRRDGPYEWNVSAAWLAGFDPARFSTALGEMSGKAVPQEQLNLALSAVEAKLDAVAALEHDAKEGTLETSDLIDGLSKFGDAAGNIAIWVMHSKPYFDLVKEQVGSSSSIFGSPIFGAQIYEGAPWSANRPVLVTDSTSLISEADGSSSGAPLYSTLGLVRGAIRLQLTELPFGVLEGPQTGSENLYMTAQTEYGYTCWLKGCQWDVTNGGSNPTDANVATATNWDTVVADNKLLPGVIIKSQ